MAAVAVANLSQEQKDELVCTYSALILHDDGMEISADNMSKLIKASGNSVEAYWPMLYAKMLNGKDVGEMLSVGGGAGGGGAGPAAGGAAGGDAGAAGGEAKKEEAPPEEEEEEMEFDLFD